MLNSFKYVIILFILISCKKEVITYDVGPNNNLDLPLTLRLNGKDCFLDIAQHYFKYALNASTNGYTPFIEFKENAIVRFEGETLENNAINNLGNIVLHQSYKIEFEYENKRTFFDLIFTNIPLVRIAVVDEILNTPKIPGKLTLNEPNKEPQIHWIGIEFRGKSSLAYEKKSFAVRTYTSIDRNEGIKSTFFDFQENEEWILDALFIDQSRVRNKISFDLWSSLETGSGNYGIKTQYVEVFVNNRQLGLYAFNEDLSLSLLNGTTASLLYKGLDNALETEFKAYPKKSPKAAVWSGWEQVLLGTSRNINWSEFSNVLSLVTNSSNEVFTNKIAEFIDLENLIDYYLFANICGAYDNVGKNWHFYKKSTADKFIIVPWDLDATWGRDAFGEKKNSNISVTNGLFERLQKLNPNNYNSLLINRWNELRNNEFSQTNLDRIIDKTLNVLKDYKAFETERLLWDKTLNLNTERSYMKGWVADRLVFLDEKFTE